MSDYPTSEQLEDARRQARAHVIRSSDVLRREARRKVGLRAGAYGLASVLASIGMVGVSTAYPNVSSGWPLLLISGLMVVMLVCAISGALTVFFSELGVTNAGRRLLPAGAEDLAAVTVVCERDIETAGLVRSWLRDLPNLRRAEIDALKPIIDAYARIDAEGASIRSARQAHRALERVLEGHAIASGT